uniref:E3 ubiquitin-protein ligase CHFR n=1 Tax=Trypanosoma congolense (strain IL3000) TaxID=1068625 RepID=G0V2B2_TRYCI|nr:unnamed protein product [Trypanosoma congolense IL3000]
MHRKRERNNQSSQRTAGNVSAVGSGECLDTALNDRIASWDADTPPQTHVEAGEDAFEEVAPSVYGPLIARLVPLRGATASSPLPLVEIYRDTDVITMGRSKELEVECRVDVARVSARHCELRVDALTYEVRIRDISTNGTFVNGVRVTKGEDVELHPGDEISLVRSLPQTMVPGESSAELEVAGGADGTGCAEFIFQRVSALKCAEKMVEELTCSVCKFLYYRPCSVLPCMHVFCSSCVSRWVADGKKTCIECRGKILEIRPSHKINNCVEQLLQRNPKLRRSEAEIAECVAHDDIPPSGKVVMKRARDTRSEALGSGSSDSDSDSVDRESFSSSSVRSGSGGSGVPNVYQNQPRRQANGNCRHCSTPSVVDGFSCPTRGIHQLCQNCHCLFPMRPLCNLPQRCQLCSCPYCNLYYKDEGGCLANANGGGLVIVSECPVPTTLPSKAFRGNAVEQGILFQYLVGKQLSPGFVWEEYVRKLSSDQWVPDIPCVNGPLSASSALCSECIEALFAAMLFHYRCSLPRDQLPSAVAERPNCWYGLECRTQFHNRQHANKYNHACHQKKRKE